MGNRLEARELVIKQLILQDGRNQVALDELRAVFKDIIADRAA